MDSDDLWDEIIDAEKKLRAQAAEATRQAEQRRVQATILEGEAAGMLRAADMLRDIERPQ